MTDERVRVSFYVLESAEPAERLGFACRLVEKAYRLANRVHAHAASASEASEFDTLLWTFRQGSFVPHEIWEAGREPEAPVTVGSGDEQPPAADLLVNLGTGVPPFYAAFRRVAEIIDGSSDGKRQGRERFRFYRAQGLEPETHRVS